MKRGKTDSVSLCSIITQGKVLQHHSDMLFSADAFDILPHNCIKLFAIA